MTEYRVYQGRNGMYIHVDDLVDHLLILSEREMDPINAIIARPLLKAIADMYENMKPIEVTK